MGKFTDTERLRQLRTDWAELRDRVDQLQSALQWALAYIGVTGDPPRSGDGELWEDYSGATRIAWPNNPEQWAE